MKKLYFMLGACLALTLAGCSDDQFEGTMVRPVSGNQVLFGAGEGEFTATNKKGRTVYGVEENQTFANYTTLTVHWIDGDKVRVFCPEASENYKWADYDVQPSRDEASVLLPVGGDKTGIRWDDTSKAHNFYAFYPSNVSHIKMDGLKTEGKVSANIPVTQEHGQLLTYSSETGQQSSTGDWKIIAPDMNFAMMTAQYKWDPATTLDPEGKINLKFTPIVSVLDVVINGPETGSYDVVQVSVRSKNQAIVGDFSYDFSTGKYGDWPDDAASDNRLATVECADGENGEPIKLEAGQKLNVKFFLLPRDIPAKELSISVLLRGGNVVTKNLVTDLTPESVASVNFEQGKIIKISSPKLNPAEQSNWMSLIADDVYFVSQLSLPGSKHSFTYNSYGGEQSSITSSNIDETIMQTFQSLSIEDQFDRGIRAFDVKVNPENDLETAYIYAGGKDLTVTLGDFLTTLKRKIDLTPSECAVIGINYVNYANTISADEWLQRVINAINEWDQSNRLSNGESMLTKVNAETTMGDMRGRIAIMIHHPAASIGSGVTIDGNFGIILGYSSSVQNRKISDYHFAQDATSGYHLQNLFQCNNPGIANGGDNYAYGSGNVGLLPYYVTDPNLVNRGEETYSGDDDLIKVKMALAEDLFSLSALNNEQPVGEKTRHMYVNDLGGFCVVKDQLSTGWRNVVNHYVYWAVIPWGYHWGTSTTAYYDYNKIPSDATWGDVNLPEANESSHSQYPQSSPLYQVPADDYSWSNGNGGNTALFAEEVNAKANSIIYNLVEDGRAPLGIVYMNFAGVDQVTFGGKTYNVQGSTLPSLIMSNNFKFALTRKNTGGDTGTDTGN